MKYRRFGDNRGVALPLALMAFVVLAALSAALLAVGSSEVQIASNHLRGTQAFFLAEAGLEHVFNTLRTTPSANLTTNAGSLQPVPGIAANTPLGGAGNYTVQYQAAGLWTWRVVSTGAGAGSSQQIRRAIMSTSFQSKNAIVNNGSLTIGGSTNVTSTGLCGNVHANGDLTLGGNTTINGSAAETNNTVQVNGGSVTVTGGIRNYAPTEPVPHIDPAGLLNDLKTNDQVRGNLLLANLYQMTVNATTNQGEVRDGNGGLIETLNSGQTSTCGWKYISGTPLAEWNLNSSTPCNGTYYFEGTVETKSAGTDANPWKTTLIATGDIKIAGNPTIQADANYTVHDTLFYSGRDVQINGTPSNGYNGVIAAHEQFELSGTGNFTGFIIGENAPNTSGSLVNATTSTVGGNIGLTYDCNSNPPLQGPLQILSWGL